MRSGAVTSKLDIALHPKTRAEEREIHLARAYRALGETMRLLADMVQPAHVRNDSHPTDEPVEDKRPRRRRARPGRGAGRREDGKDTRVSGTGTFHNGELNFGVRFRDNSELEMTGRLQDATLTGTATGRAWGVVDDAAEGAWSAHRQ